MNSVGNSMCHTAGKQQPLLAICCSFKAAANCHLHENAWHSLCTRHSFSIRHKGELCIKFINAPFGGVILYIIETRFYFYYSLFRLLVMLRPCGFLAPKRLILAIKYFYLERIWWRLFLKHIVCTKLDIYVFTSSRVKRGIYFK